MCKLSSEVTCANNVDVSNEYDSMVTGVEENARSQVCNLKFIGGVSAPVEQRSNQPI